MIGRRSFLAACAVAPLIGAASAKPEEFTAWEVRLGLTRDPEQRLFRLRWHFECRARHKWEVVDAHNWSYAGSGWGNDPVPDGNAKTYEPRYVWGEGATAIEAIDDWYHKLPPEKVDVLFWRVKPELTSERDFDSKETRWRVFSRFAIVPLGELKA